ncbi:hypothetical protein CDAR_10531 [Caerostris darwini]|uniref:Uncharacterized protein n=1 Tax=Caerostris darwini TaxID=1538125 RepID=A0AAV4NS22_9ARAC|nr:hypothetical protein CDAR_10531 [Caerostris darwini]
MEVKTQTVKDQENANCPYMSHGRFDVSGENQEMGESKKRDQELSEIRDRTSDRETSRILLQQKKLIPVFPVGIWIAFVSHLL